MGHADASFSGWLADACLGSHLVCFDDRLLRVRALGKIFVKVSDLLIKIIELNYNEIAQIDTL